MHSRSDAGAGALLERSIPSIVVYKGGMAVHGAVQPAGKEFMQLHVSSD